MRNKCKILFVLLIGILMLNGCGISELLGGMVSQKEAGGDALLESASYDYLEGDYESALEKLLKAEIVGVSDEEVLIDLYSVTGNTYLELDDYENAISYHEKALALDPDSVVCVVNLAVSHRKNGDMDKAKELYMKGLEIDPEYAELNSSLGSLYILENEPEKAIEYFEKAIKLDDNLAVAYANAALAYAMTGDMETADDYLNKAILRGYDNTENLKELIEQFR